MDPIIIIVRHHLNLNIVQALANNQVLVHLHLQWNHIISRLMGLEIHRLMGAFIIVGILVVGVGFY